MHTPVFVKSTTTRNDYNDISLHHTKILHYHDPDNMENLQIHSLESHVVAAMTEGKIITRNLWTKMQHLLHIGDLRDKIMKDTNWAPEQIAAVD